MAAYPNIEVVNTGAPSSAWSTEITPKQTYLMSSELFASSAPKLSWQPGPESTYPALNSAQLAEVRAMLEGMNKDTLLHIVWGAIGAAGGAFPYEVMTPMGPAIIIAMSYSKQRVIKLRCLGEIVGVVSDLGFRLSVVGPSEAELTDAERARAWATHQDRFNHEMKELLG